MHLLLVELFAEISYSSIKMMLVNFNFSNKDQNTILINLGIR